MSLTWDDLAAQLGKDTRQISRWRKIEGAPTEPDPEAWKTWLEDRNGPPVDPTGLPGVCDYDQAVGAGRIDYTKAHKREQVVEQAIINDLKREELRKLRGDLIPRDEVEKKVRTITAAALEVLNELPDLAANAAEAARKPAARQLAREWVDALRARMAERLRLG